ncbi:MAG TPA: hypothetical protein VMU14_12100 [Acidimicrobiales bacterium]|nr:hypothetical protein [Acidimicrobiales bacterium]
MGMTRATGGPVRCPWCSRPVSDGPGSPEACPSCGVPLSPAVVRSRQAAAPITPEAARHRKSQRLRALATVLALTAVMLIISAIGVAAAVFRASGSDSDATATLQSALRAAEGIRAGDTSGAQGGFANVTPATLETRLPGITLVSSLVASNGPKQVSMVVSNGGNGTYGWYGALRSKSGRCFAAATVNDVPKELTMILPGNCTGDAARAALMPLASDSPSMVPSNPSSGTSAQAAAG